MWFMETYLSTFDSDIDVLTRVDHDKIPEGTIYKFWLHLVTDGIGQPILIPIMIAKGNSPGKTLGLTAAVHGNEINGIPIIQSLFQHIDVTQLCGMLIGIPVVNVPSLLRKKRRFPDGSDLNHIMPGKPYGNVGQVYAYRFFNQIVKHFDYLVDLHTASFGRVNSYYIRADMDDPGTAKMALLQNAQIIVHNPPSDGTLRGAAESIGIPSITLEVGDPNKFQKGMVRSSLTGIHNLLIHMGMLKGTIEPPDNLPVICRHSFWMYTDAGGILTIEPKLTDWVKKGDRVAMLRNIFGDRIKEYFAPDDGIIVGKGVNPIVQTGGRILHLGLTTTSSNERK